jgi:hypothetical protein
MHMQIKPEAKALRVGIWGVESAGSRCRAGDEVVVRDQQ